MIQENYSFPQYRKNATGSSFYKIESENVFEEKQLIGNNVWKHRITANQFPEKRLIQDMLNCHNNQWQVITEEEYKKV